MIAVHVCFGTSTACCSGARRAHKRHAKWQANTSAHIVHVALDQGARLAAPLWSDTTAWQSRDCQNLNADAPERGDASCATHAHHCGVLATTWSALLAGGRAAIIRDRGGALETPPSVSNSAHDFRISLHRPAVAKRCQALPGQPIDMCGAWLDGTPQRADAHELRTTARHFDGAKRDNTSNVSADDLGQCASAAGKALGKRYHHIRTLPYDSP